jgi:F420-non-reducing hydrogenase large subunit
MTKIIAINPMTRLEGHGSIQLVLDDQGRFQDAFLQVPDFKGFEKFCEGRAVEELPALTQKICGVCPTAHHIAGVKALDDLFDVAPPPAANIIRELMLNAFIFEDHLLHFYYLGGPDFIVEPAEPANRRNVFGVIDKMGTAFGQKILSIRRRVRQMHSVLSGSALYPVCGLPGGVSKTVSRKERDSFDTVVRDALEFAQLTLALFYEHVLGNERFRQLMRDPAMTSDTYYMGLVDAQGHVNFYDGLLRVIDPKGLEVAAFSVKDYGVHLAERIDTFSYMKPLYLKHVGWIGLSDGLASGIYRVGPLARLNVAKGVSTPLAQAEYERMGEALGGWPVHHTFAYHWARLIEVLYAAEKMAQLIASKDLTNPKVRNLPTRIGKAGMGVCEAPRGTLIHHYEADGKGITQKVNLLVATQNNAAAIQLSIAQAARALLKQGRVTDEMHQMLEMVFRAYDPCMACATH